MNKEDKILAMLESIYIEQQETNKLINNSGQDLKGIKQTVAAIDQDLKGIEQIVATIEQEHGKKLDALFDVYVQNTQMLVRIEKGVTRQGEIIMHRIK